MKTLERWRKPFKDLPSDANWIAVNIHGLSHWYSVAPYYLSGFWVNEGLSGYLGRFPTLAHPYVWRKSIREVMPEERVGYKPEEAP